MRDRPRHLATYQTEGTITSLKHRLEGRSAAITSFVLLAILWQLTAVYTPSFVVPRIDVILSSFVRIFTTWELLQQGLITVARTIAGIVLSLLIGVPVGLLMGVSTRIDDHLRPIIKFIMGIPALNWVIIVIIWFSQIEIRILTVIFVIAAPIYVFNIYDGVRSIEQETKDMVKSFRTTFPQYVRILLWPHVIQNTITASRIVTGVATRVVLVAELVGATTGIGRQLALAKGTFDMPMVFAWTLFLVVELQILEAIVEVVDRHVMAWRGNENA